MNEKPQAEINTVLAAGALETQTEHGHKGFGSVSDLSGPCVGATSKPILDACCGSRMFWFDKDNQNVIFGDKRNESHILCDGRVLNVKPDIKMDFTDIPFDDESFNLVVFDPPHFSKLGANSWMAKKYGKLFPGWEIEIKAGFDECMRVLKTNGTLIFKWNTRQIKLKYLLNILEASPLFGHTSRKNGETIWMTFMKF